MLKLNSTLLLISISFLLNCGTPNDPESIDGNTGGYSIVSRVITAGSAQALVVNNSFAYVAQGEGGLMIFDISNTRDPQATAILSEELRGFSYKIAIRDSVLYLASGSWGISVVNAADPYNPAVTADNLPLKPARDFYIMGNFLFTTISEEGVRISEISYAPQPDIRGGMSTPGYARGIIATTDSNYLLVSCGEMGLAIYDISQLQNGFGNYPRVGWVDTPGYAEDVTFYPEFPYAFIACGTSGLIIADYSDLDNIRIIGSYDTGGYAKEVLYHDGKLYVTAGTRGLQIFSVSNPTSPSKIGTVQTNNARGIAIDDNYVYLADEDEGLIIIAMP